MIDIPTWFMALFSLLVIGCVAGVFMGVAYAVKYHDMVATVNEFRWYMKELVPQKYHVQGHKPAEPKSAPHESHNAQQVFQQL